MLARAAAIVLTAVLAAPASGGEPAFGEGEQGGDVEARLVLHTRGTDRERFPETNVLFDRTLRTFDLSRYLVPEGRDRYLSTFVSASIEGTALGGDLRWALLADTGELRRQRFPLAAAVCAAKAGTSPTGLDVVGSGNCDLTRFGPVPVEETGLGPLELTANGRTFQDEVVKTLLVREAYAAYSLGPAGFATARAGRKRITVGDGFVYDDYATGAELDLDLGSIGPQWDFAFSFFQPTRDFPNTVAGISPMLAVRADFLPSLFERAGLFAAFNRDRTGSVGELFRGALVETLAAHLARDTPGTLSYVSTALALSRTLAARIESDASSLWLGTSGRLAPLRGLRLAWTAAALGGRIDRVWITTTLGDRVLAQDVQLHGRMASIRSEVSLGDALTLGAWILYLSGGAPLTPTVDATGQLVPAGGSYRGFLGIAPFVTATNLFFGGGLSETFAARQATAPGVNGRGVAAPGATLRLDATDAISIEGKAAYLVADVDGPFGGRIYGTEADLQAVWSPRPWFTVGAELDVLWPGDFYPAQNTVYKTVLAVDLLYL